LQEVFNIQSARRLYKAFQPEPKSDSDSRQSTENRTHRETQRDSSHSDRDSRQRFQREITAREEIRKRRLESQSVLRAINKEEPLVAASQ
jgi:hypothetical protein